MNPIITSDQGLNAQLLYKNNLVACTLLRLDAKESWGEPWTLDCTWLLQGNSLEVNPWLKGQSVKELEVWWGLGQQNLGRKGWVHSLQWKPMGSNRIWLQTKCGMFPLDWQTQTNRRVYRNDYGLQSILQQNPWNIRSWNFKEKSVPDSEPQQWLQIDETNSDFVLRTLGRLGWGLWHVPSDSDGSFHVGALPKLDSVLSPLPPDPRWREETLRTHPEGFYAHGSAGLVWCGLTLQWEDRKSDLEGQWVAYEIRHCMDRSASVLGSGQAMPYRYEIQWQHPRDFAKVFIKQRTILRPLLQARIGGQTEHCPASAKGEYPLKFAWEEANETAWGRLWRLQPWAGLSGRMHLPLLPNTKVLVGFSHEDVDTPLILGAMESPEDLPDDSWDGRAQWISPHGGGMDWDVHDAAEPTMRWYGRQQWEFALKEGPEGSIRWGAVDGSSGGCVKANGTQIELRTKSGIAIRLDDGAGSMECSLPNGEIFQIASARMACSAGGQTLVLDKQEGISLCSDRKIQITAPQVQIEANEEIQILSNGKFQTLAKGKMQLKTEQTLGLLAASEFSVQSENCRMQSTNDCVIESSTTQIKSDGPISLQGSLIELN